MALGRKWRRRSSFSPSLRRWSFCAASSAAHGLKHDNIVKLYGVCVDDPDWVCLLMELVPRGSLRKLLEAAPEKVTGSESMQLKLAHGIAAGMAYLHGRTPPMLHNDLKSKNVLLGENIDGLVPKIADFAVCEAKVPRPGQFG